MKSHPDGSMFIVIEKPVEDSAPYRTTRYFLTEDFTTDDGYSLQKGQELLVYGGDSEGVVCDIVVDYERLGDWQTRIPNRLVEERTFETRLAHTRKLG